MRVSIEKKFDEKYFHFSSSNYCGGCNALWYLDGKLADCMY